MDDLLSEFLEETGEALEELDNSLVALEREPNNLEILEQIFRVVHTIKGTCGFLDLPRLEGLSHATEDKLSLFREGKEPITSDGITLVLAALDRIKALLHQLGQTGKELAGHDQELIAKLGVAAGAGRDGVSPAVSDVSVSSDGDDGDPFERETPESAGAQDAEPEHGRGGRAAHAAHVRHELEQVLAFEAEADAETEEAEAENAENTENTMGLADIWKAVSSRTGSEAAEATANRHRFSESEPRSGGGAGLNTGPEPEAWSPRDSRGQGHTRDERDETGSRAVGDAGFSSSRSASSRGGGSRV